MEPLSQPPSLEQVAEELSIPLHRYFGRYVGNPALADDLLQETLIRIARGLPGFAGRASAKTWAFSIATRVAIQTQAVRAVSASARHFEYGMDRNVV